jgi:hypothetical protein
VPIPPTFPIPVLTVRPWEDPVIDELGHDPRSAYVERFWLTILGPTATWLVRRLASGFDAAPGGYELDLATTAMELGLGHHSGKNAPFLRSIDRLCRFGSAEPVDRSTLRVRRKVPPLTRVQIERLPESLRAEHQAWLDRPVADAPLAFEQIRHRARQLALSLLQLGEDGEATERQLHRWRIHPSLAHEATAWAVAKHREAQEARERRSIGGGGGGPLDAA